jgi:CCR4-NOT transcription complex subunit 3
MEKFKACEKEMKTKAFSKEGLSAAAKLDPKEQQKLDLCQWIQTMVEELSRQVEQAEAELETIQGLKSKKKDSEREARLEELERLNERRSWHINRLELILRLLENGNLQTDSVTNVKDDIAYFVESNTVSQHILSASLYSRCTSLKIGSLNTHRRKTSKKMKVSTTN